MSEVSSEAVEAAARALGDRALEGAGFDGFTDGSQEGFRAQARVALTAALPYLSPRVAPSAEAVRDELSGWPIGSGYYATKVGTDEARDMANAVLAMFASQPTVGRCARCGKPVLVPYDDPDNEAGECCPSCTHDVWDASVAAHDAQVREQALRAAADYIEGQRSTVGSGARALDMGAWCVEVLREQADATDGGE